jgi:hypothetical protein
VASNIARETQIPSPKPTLVARVHGKAVLQCGVLAASDISNMAIVTSKCVPNLPYFWPCQKEWTVIFSLGCVLMPLTRSRFQSAKMQYHI